MSYNRRKIKSKTCTSVKKWFFSKTEVFQDDSLFGEIVSTDFHSAKQRITVFVNSAFSFCVMHNEEELWKLAGISMFGLMEKSHSSQSNSHE